jgi:hypothetical protein
MQYSAELKFNFLKLFLDFTHRLRIIKIIRFGSWSYFCLQAKGGRVQVWDYFEQRVSTD